MLTRSRLKAIPATATAAEAGTVATTKEDEPASVETTSSTASTTESEPAGVVSSSNSEASVTTKPKTKSRKSKSKNTTVSSEEPARLLAEGFPFRVRSNINASENASAYKTMMDYTKVRLTSFFKAGFGKAMKNKVLEEGKTLRGLYELLGAAQQCKATIGAFKENDPCWICGYPIESGGICEHVLPICQATIYWKLYRRGAEKNAAAFEKIKMEYEWAHQICNALKSDISLIKQGPNNTLVIDENAIKEELLRPIMYKFAEKSPKKASLYTETWLEGRVKPISDRVTLLINEINKAPEKTLLLGLAAALDVRQFERPAREMLTGIHEVYAPWKNLLDQLPSHAEAEAVHIQGEAFVKEYLKTVADEFATIYENYPPKSPKIVKEGDHFKKMLDGKRRLYQSTDIYTALKELFFDENFISIYYDFPYFLTNEIESALEIVSAQENNNNNEMPPLIQTSEEIVKSATTFAQAFCQNQIMKYLSKHASQDSDVMPIITKLFKESAAVLVQTYVEKYKESKNPKLQFILTHINDDNDFETLMNMMIIELVPPSAYAAYPWLGGGRRRKTRKHRK